MNPFCLAILTKRQEFANFFYILEGELRDRHGSRAGCQGNVLDRIPLHFGKASRKFIEEELNYLPDLFGFELLIWDLDSFPLEELKNCILNRNLSIPIIATGSNKLPYSMREIMNAGADDFIEESADLSLWISTVEMRVKRSQHLLCRYEEKVADLSNQLSTAHKKNPLTKLPNNLALQEFIATDIQSRKRNNPLTIAYLDLDKFKKIDRILGESKADRILVEIAERLLKKIRIEDHIFHIRSDKFLLIYEGKMETPIANQWAEDLLAFIRQPWNALEQRIVITASLGLSIWDIEDSACFNLKVEAARQAMFQAQETGGNAYHFYVENFEDSSIQEWSGTHVEEQLRQAIKNLQFSLVFQPKIDIATQRAVGLEALLRWNHSKMGTISPNFFIPHAEQSGLIIPIGRWVLEESLQQILYLQRAGWRNFHISVNVSMRQFRNLDLAQEIGELLEQYQVDPHYLDLEITESTLMDNVDLVLSQMNRLRAKGVTFSLDDFGIGYSSLAYLAELPIDYLKIDRVFIRHLRAGTQDYDIVQSIIALSKKMGLTVIAEGVEMGEQLSLLAEMGCDQFQGFLFSKPAPIDILLHQVVS